MTSSISREPHITSASELLEDPVSRELMVKAVTLVPCGHVFNEDTIINCLARNRLCPLDRQRIERYIPNFTIRNLAELQAQQPVEEEPTEEAQEQFHKGKELAEAGIHDQAIEALLKALTICPTYKKAQTFLDFLLEHLSQKPLPIPAVSSQPITKDSYTEHLLRLLENAVVQQNLFLKSLIENLLKELFEQTNQELSAT